MSFVDGKPYLHRHGGGGVLPRRSPDDGVSGVFRGVALVALVVAAGLVRLLLGRYCCRYRHNQR